jgi:hypothetical protein
LPAVFCGPRPDLRAWRPVRRLLAAAHFAARPRRGPRLACSRAARSNRRMMIRWPTAWIGWYKTPTTGRNPSSLAPPLSVPLSVLLVAAAGEIAPAGAPPVTAKRATGTAHHGDAFPSHSSLVCSLTPATSGLKLGSVSRGGLRPLASVDPASNAPLRWTVARTLPPKGVFPFRLWRRQAPPVPM